MSDYLSRPHPDAGYEPWARAALDRGEGLTVEQGRCVVDKLDCYREGLDTMQRDYGAAHMALDEAHRQRDEALARLAELEAGEVTTGYAVHWPADATHGPDPEHDDEYERHDNRDDAERVVRAYSAEGATLAQQQVRTVRDPWTEAT